MKFSPEGILLAPTTNCNLSCPHCITQKSGAILSKRHAVQILRQCRDIGIKRVGFTGGEPFLAPDFLYAVVKNAVGEGMLFDRIMTNAVWYKNQAILRKTLETLYRSGYDGSICVSADALHSQAVKKIASFIVSAVSIWKRPDIVSIAYVSGSRDRATKSMLEGLSRILSARLFRFGRKGAVIRNSSIFIKVNRIDLSPIGKASRLKNPWGKRWFKEDYCEGPGHVFFILPDGGVKPCCGYATESPKLTIGNIKRDSVQDIMEKARKNRFLRAVFGWGLTAIRKRAEGLGFRFPGKTDNSCYFCHYILTEMPEHILEKCLN